MSRKKTKKLTDFWWNYRIVRRSVKRPGYTETWLELVEAHYTPKNRSVPNMISPGGAKVFGDNKKQLKWALRNMAKALDRPVLNFRKYVSKKMEASLREQGLI